VVDNRDACDSEGAGESAPRDLSARQRDLAVAGWSSFLVAAVGTMVTFAFVDPLAFVNTVELPLSIDRMTGYAIGFFFLWTLTGATAALTLYLTRTSHAESPR
jgi:uncharacterized RDD family membrane protein YckC